MSNSIHSLTVGQLRRAVAIKEQIEKLQNEISSITGNRLQTSAKTPTVTSKGRRMSAAGRARIAAAARARWAKIKGTPPPEKTPKKRKMSAAAKAKLSAAAKARWQKVKAAGKTAL